MSDSDSGIGFGLNEHHQKNLWNYLRFIRYIRTQNIRTIDSCFQDIKNSKLTEDTYTLEEVQDIIEEILSVVKIDIESEWLNLTHTNALLLKQLFSQAEKWHLKLQVDTSQLENIDLLVQVKEFEERQMLLNPKDRTAHSNEPLTQFHLEPMNDIGCSALLQQEINKLQEENLMLRDRLKTIESQASSLLSDRSKLTDDLRQVKSNFESNLMEKSENVNRELTSLSEQLSEAKNQLETLQVSSSQKEDLETNLTQVTHHLLQVQAKLEKKEKDLEAKINQTTAFVNLKKMLHQKNELVKSLRKKLEKYEPIDDENCEEDEAAKN